VSDPRYARSFDSVAEQYERARPEYAEAGVDWLVEELRLRAGDPVLDLAAGTGKLTRQLVRRDLSVVAVEPGDEMRAVLKRVLPEVAALTGTAEAIPLHQWSFDAVTVGQAFHWFEPEAALAEIKRVLRPGSGFALLWNRWDEEDPLLSQVDALLDEIRPPVTRRDDFDFEHERRTFRQLRPMTVDAIVEWAGSTSGWVNASGEEAAGDRSRDPPAGRGVRRRGLDRDRRDRRLARERRSSRVRGNALRQQRIHAARRADCAPRGADEGS